MYYWSVGALSKEYIVANRCNPATPPTPIAHIVSNVELKKTRARAVNVLTIDTSLLLFSFAKGTKRILMYRSKIKSKAMEPTTVRGIEPPPITPIGQNALFSNITHITFGLIRTLQITLYSDLEAVN